MNACVTDFGSLAHFAKGVQVKDRLLCRTTEELGDVAAMPADIGHRGYSPKRSMLIVWENNDHAVARLHQQRAIPPYPVEF